MVTLAEILRRHWPACRAKFGNAIPPAHRAAVAAILSCRTAGRGGQLFACPCGAWHYAYHSCGHRACHQCGHGAAKEWATRQQHKLLPVPYFLVTFTVPEELRAVIRAHAKVLHATLFTHSAGALADVALTKLGVELGFTGVLHTWTRQLIYHPHVHYLVPGGGLTPDGLRWKRVTDPDFLLPTKVLAVRFKNRLRQWLEVEHQELLRQIPGRAWRIAWVVDVQPVGRGHTALKYLAAYVQKTALSASRLVACDERTVTFTHQDRATGETKSLRLSGEEFLRRFLQHVLPTGLQRVRHFGWLSPAAKKRWQRIHALLDWKPAAPPDAAVPALSQADAAAGHLRPLAAMRTIPAPQPLTRAAVRTNPGCANGAVSSHGGPGGENPPQTRAADAPARRVPRPRRDPGPPGAPGPGRRTPPATVAPPARGKSKLQGSPPEKKTPGD